MRCERVYVALAVVAVGAVLCPGARAEPASEDFRHFYVVGREGSVWKYNSGFECVLSGGGDASGRFRGVSCAALSPDGTRVFLGLVNAPVACVRTSDLKKEETCLPEFPPRSPDVFEYGANRIIAPSSRFLFVLDASYNFGRGDPLNMTDCTLHVDLLERRVKPLPGLRLLNTDRTRISPGGDKILIIDIPMKLVDVGTGTVEKIIPAVDDPKIHWSKRERRLYGLDVDWQHGILDEWRTRPALGGGLEIERAWVDLKTGEERSAEGPSPWPDNLPRGPRNVLINIGTFSHPSGDLQYKAGDVVLQSWEAQAFARLRPEWLPKVTEELGQSYLSPAGKYLLCIGCYADPTGSEGPELAYHEWRMIRVMNTYTGEMAKEIRVDEPVEAILFE